MHLESDPAKPWAPFAGCSNRTYAIRISCSSCGKEYSSTPKNEYYKELQTRRRGSASTAGKCGACTKRQQQENSKKTVVRRYGVPNVSMLAEVDAKKRATCLKNFGVAYPQQSAEVRAKTEAAVVASYGVANVSQAPEVRAKQVEGIRLAFGRDNAFAGSEGVALAKEGMQKKYGTDNPMRVPEIVSRHKEATLASLGVDNPFKSEDIKKVILEKGRLWRTSEARRAVVASRQAQMLSERLPDGWAFRTPDVDDTHYEVECPSCGFSWRLHKSNPWAMLPPDRQSCPSCKPASYAETYLEGVVPSGVNCVRNDRSVLSSAAMAAVGMPKVKRALELDYYFPEQRLAIEVNGLYYHSEDVLLLGHQQWSLSEVRRFHWYKWRACLAQGITLLSLWETEVRLPAIRNMLVHRLSKTSDKIGARELEPSFVPAAEANAFHAAHHVQGKSNCVTSLGLREESGALRAVMSFGSAAGCRTRADHLVLQRFSTSGSVPGAASRLLSLARQSVDLPFVSFSDNRFGSGRLYETLGFRLDREYAPDYFYVRRLKTFSKRARQKEDLQREAREKGLSAAGTEAALAEALGYHRVWDCGKRAWILPPLQSPATDAYT